ncbi:MAG: hypothetical protein IPH82_23020 [Chloroflexi bacterium]|nr:hypothetical protein [Chloroflexota bacterium]MBK8934139.1 hypothetical protein [Chloroflexota bacterium]
MMGQTTLNEVEVAVDGRLFNAGLLSGLGEVRVQQRLSLPDQAELSFFDSVGSLEAIEEFAPGMSLQITSYHRDAAARLFVGEITAVEHIYHANGSYEIQVRGYDKLHQMRNNQSLRVFENATIVGVAEKVAKPYNIKVKGGATHLRWPQVFQHHQSDLELLVEMAARDGLYVTLRGGELHLMPHTGIGEAVKLNLRQDLLEARLEQNSDLSRQRVTASGWDTQFAKAQASGNAKPSDLQSPARSRESSAAHWLNESLVDRDQAEALAAADMQFRRSVARTLWGVAVGNPLLRPGTPVELVGASGASAQRYVLASVIHRMSNQMDYITEIDSRLPDPRPRPRGAAITVGIVTTAQDPKENGRVRVHLPAYGGVESGWLPVLTVGAGQQKGLVMLPAPNDTVLVLLAYEDPAQGIVLGGLYGTINTPDSGVNAQGQVHRYTWTTPQGQRIQLDNDDNSVRLENSGALMGPGSLIDIKDGEITIKNQAGSYIKLDGDQIIIAGKAIDFQSL